jgi:hypothetical protein
MTDNRRLQRPIGEIDDVVIETVTDVRIDEVDPAPSESRPAYSDLPRVCGSYDELEAFGTYTGLASLTPTDEPEGPR